MTGPLVYRVGAALDPSDYDFLAPGPFAEDALLQDETDRAAEFDVPPEVRRVSNTGECDETRD